MKNSNTIIVAIAFIILLVFLANPFDFWMPNVIEYMTAAAVVVVAVIFSGLVWKEKVRDEREVELRAHAARAGYLAGIYALVFAIAFSVLSGNYVDTWVIVALGVMILVRLLVRLKEEKI